MSEAVDFCRVLVEMAQEARARLHDAEITAKVYRAHSGPAWWREKAIGAEEKVARARLEFEALNAGAQCLGRHL